MNLKNKIKSLPSSPGVYLMKDPQGSIIYVGKSKNLKSRVGSYFQNSKAHPPKVLKLVKNLRDFDYILTDTEFEAFMLECKLIKMIKPLYNKKMKSPMSYPYIVINISEYYPSIQVLHEPGRSGDSLIWGPYTNKNTVERGVQGIKECCSILCSSNFKNTSACLNYSLGLCIGMCLGSPAIRSQYLNIIDKIINLLNGTDKSILEKMEYTMNCAAENFDFEKAAKYRDYISAVKYLINKSEVIDFAEANENIVLVEPLEKHIIKYFLIKGPRVHFSEKYDLESGSLEELTSAIKNNLLLYFNSDDETDTKNVSRDEIDESQIIYSYIKSSDNNSRHVIIPEAWIKNKCLKNIYDALSKLLSTYIA